MTAAEIVVIIVGGLLGYWMIASLLKKKPTASRTSGGGAGNTGGTERGGNKENSSNDKNADGANYSRPSWSRVLGVSENASRDEIVAAYKKRISEYHPDKVSQMGAEIRELAESRSKEINAAYDEATNRWKR